MRRYFEGGFFGILLLGFSNMMALTSYDEFSKGNLLAADKAFLNEFKTAFQNNDISLALINFLKIAVENDNPDAAKWASERWLWEDWAYFNNWENSLTEPWKGAVVNEIWFKNLIIDSQKKEDEEYKKLQDEKKKIDDKYKVNKTSNPSDIVSQQALIREEKDRLSEKFHEEFLAREKARIATIKNTIAQNLRPKLNNLIKNACNTTSGMNIPLDAILFLVAFWGCTVDSTAIEKTSGFNKNLLEAIKILILHREGKLTEAEKLLSSDTIVLVMRGALETGHFEIIKWLLELKPDNSKGKVWVDDILNGKPVPTKNGWVYPIGAACKYGDLDAAKYDMGGQQIQDGSFGIEEYFGRKPLQVACLYAQPELVEYLSHFPSVKPDEIITKDGQEETALIAAIKGPDEQLRNKEAERHEVVELLLRPMWGFFNSSSNINILGKCKESNGKSVSPLFWAFVRCQPAIAELLVLNGLTLNSDEISIVSKMTLCDDALLKFLYDFTKTGDSLKPGQKMETLVNFIKAKELAYRPALSFAKNPEFKEKKEVSVYEGDAASLLYKILTEGNLKLLELMISCPDFGKNKENKTLTFGDILRAKDKGGISLLEYAVYNPFARKEIFEKLMSKFELRLTKEDHEIINRIVKFGKDRHEQWTKKTGGTANALKANPSEKLWIMQVLEGPLYKELANGMGVLIKLAKTGAPADFENKELIPLLQEFIDTPVDVQDNTLLHLAGNRTTWTDTSERDAVIGKLIENGATIKRNKNTESPTLNKTWKDSEGNTLLHLAAYAGNDMTVITLFKNFDLSVTSTNNKGQTPLHKAVEGAHKNLKDVILSLVWIGSDPNTGSPSPFELAAILGNLDAVKAFVEAEKGTVKSPQIPLLDNTKLKAIQSAITNKKFDVVQYLFDTYKTFYESSKDKATITNFLLSKSTESANTDEIFKKLASSLRSISNS